MARTLPPAATRTMNPMKNALLFGLTFLASASLWAQDDARSKAVVDKLIAKHKSYTAFECAFSTRLVSKKDGLDVDQKGTMKVKGSKFRLVLDNNTIVNDGTALWTFNKDANEVTVTDAKDIDQDMDPTKLFTQYGQGFKSQWVEEKTDATTGAVLQTIKLFPLEAGKKPFHTVIMTVDKAKSEPRTVRVLYKEGNEVVYTLDKFTGNSTLADALFVFDKSKFPGVEITDLR
jgi:outer membrane lipoprotein carrier protein